MGTPILCREELAFYRAKASYDKQKLAKEQAEAQSAKDTFWARARPYILANSDGHAGIDVRAVTIALARAMGLSATTTGNGNGVRDAVHWLIQANAASPDHQGFTSSSTIDLSRLLAA